MNETTPVSQELYSFWFSALWAQHTVPRDEYYFQTFVRGVHISQIKPLITR